MHFLKKRGTPVALRGAPVLGARGRPDRPLRGAFFIQRPPIKRQPIVSLLTPEDEYLTATLASCQEFGWEGCWGIYVMTRWNNHYILWLQLSNCIIKDCVFHKRKKHIDAKYHFIRELVNNGETVLQHCRLEEQFADIFTKPLAREEFFYLIDWLGMVNGDSCD